MFVDALLVVSDAQAFAATGVSTNSIDTRSPAVQNLEIGSGTPIGFGITVDVAADATTGDETYVFDLLSDDVNTLGSPTLILSYTIARARLVAGSAWFLPIPPREPQEQFIGIRATLGGTTPSITITAWLTGWDQFAETYKAYAKGYTIS
jgi:hypothetical protein